MTYIIPIYDLHRFSYLKNKTNKKFQGDYIFAKRVFKGIIINFDHRPNQDKNAVANVGGLLPHDGDLFYVVSGNDSTKNSNSLSNSDLGVKMM